MVAGGIYERNVTWAFIGGVLTGLPTQPYCVPEGKTRKHRGQPSKTKCSFPSPSSINSVFPTPETDTQRKLHRPMHRGCFLEHAKPAGV